MGRNPGASSAACHHPFRVIHDRRRLPRRDRHADAEERRLVDGIAARSDEIVALLCDLIRFDTTSRSAPDEPARDEAALQRFLAGRLEAAGACADVWEPAAGEVEGHPLCPAGGIGFAGRPQMAARFKGAGGGTSLLFNGHIDVVPARREDGWEADPFDPQVADGRVTGRGACDMKGGIAAMVVAAEAVAAAGGLAGDLVVCTNTDEESSGVGGLACARHGVARRLRDRDGAELARGLARVPRLRLLRDRGAGPRRAHGAGARELPRRRRGQRDREGPPPARGRRPPARGVAQPRRRAPPAARPARHRRQPAGRRRGLARDDPRQGGAHARRADPARAGRRRRLDARACARRSRASCGRGARPTRGWPRTRRGSPGTPRSTRPRRPSTRRACRRCSAPTRRSGCRARSAGSAPGTTARPTRSRPGRPRSCTGRARIDRAHTVGEWVPVADLVACAQGLALAAWRLCR